MTLLDVAREYINLYIRTDDEKWLEEARLVINEHKIGLLGDFLEYEEQPQAV